MTSLIALDKILPLLPAIAGVIFALSALYSKTLLDALGRGLDKTVALKNVSARDRQSALEVIENVLKIDEIATVDLTPAQRYQLIERTLNDRREAAQQRYALLRRLATIMFALSVGWMIYSWSSSNTDTVTARLIDQDRQGFAKAVAREGFYNLTDAGLVQRLAQDTEVPASVQDIMFAIDKLNKLENCDRQALSEQVKLSKQGAECNLALSDLRKKARLRVAPFNEPGMLFDVGRAEVETEPRRFFVHVTENFPFRGIAVEVINPANRRRLVLFPRQALVTDGDEKLVHLNEEQRMVLFDRKDIVGGTGPSTWKVAIRPIDGPNPILSDPSCSDRWRSRDQLCEIAEQQITYNELTNRLSR